jgi:hypothetical protein
LEFAVNPICTALEYCARSCNVTVELCNDSILPAIFLAWMI